MDKTVIILGCMDSKGEEYGYIKRHIEKTGLKTILIDVGVIGEPVIKPDITNIFLTKIQKNCFSLIAKIRIF